MDPELRKELDDIRQQLRELAEAILWMDASKDLKNKSAIQAIEDGSYTDQ